MTLNCVNCGKAVDKPSNISWDRASPAVRINLSRCCQDCGDTWAKGVLETLSGDKVISFFPRSPVKIDWFRLFGYRDLRKFDLYVEALLLFIVFGRLRYLADKGTTCFRIEGKDGSCNPRLSEKDRELLFTNYHDACVYLGILESRGGEGLAIIHIAGFTDPQQAAAEARTAVDY